MSNSVARFSAHAKIDHESAYHRLRFTYGQREYLSCTSPVALWRDANQVGKSYALAILAHDVCRGLGRFAPLPWKPPNEVMVCGTSWDQMVPLMEKIWQLAPRGELDPRNGWDPGRGITGKPPRIVYRKGPGKGSIIHFATYKQGPQRVAGFTVPLVIGDEPMPEAFYGELRPRVLRYGGWIRIGFTPTLEAPPLDWLWEMCDSGLIKEYNWGLNEDACWLRNDDGSRAMCGPWKTAAQIEEFEAGLLPSEREMRMGRSRHRMVAGRVFDVFHDGLIEERYPPADWLLCVGVDHGSIGGSQVFVLTAVKVMPGNQVAVAVLDEALSDGTTSSDQDAAMVSQMLTRNGLTWRKIDLWVGDRKHGGRHWGGQKSNVQFMSAYGRLLGSASGNCPFQVHTAKKPGGSIWAGIRLLKDAMIHNRFWIRPNCETTINSLRYWAEGDDEHKHAIDALRYPVFQLVRQGGRGVGNVRLH